ncbi:MAG: N-acetylglucosamine-6-phosphate deacetylase [Kangiellaceae bacterium]|nr:N-acetylglucosamine-6-phosphate deacetylase [Kangiellaceae bacterium]MCW9001034.1 N-acetylglucosamine-6-phosphate deacetylase [Kangiellaceae bacterium]
MNTFQFAVEQVFTGNELLCRQVVSVVDGRIEKIEPCDAEQNLISGVLTAGFIDTQVNGGGGFLFNTSPDADSLKQIAKAHQKFGTTAWLPTLVTDSLGPMQKCADAVAKAIKDPANGIVGIHFEGPHLTVEKKGVHSAKLIREVSEKEIELFCRHDLGKVMVTLAPENASPETIERLVEAGVIVSMGHSNATYEQTRKAIDAGATGFTHLFNAMSGLTSREPGMVGAALNSPHCFAGIIMDRIHVDPVSAAIAYQSNKNLMLVTDAMPPVGCEQKEFEFFGDKIIRLGNKLTDSEGRLAGSALNMMTAVNNTVEDLAISQTDAFNLASLNPAKFLGLENDLGSLAPGKKASMVLVNQSGEVAASWVEGIQVV